MIPPSISSYHFLRFFSLSSYSPKRREVKKKKQIKLMANLHKRKYLPAHSTFSDEGKNHFYHCIRFMLSEWVQHLIRLCVALLRVFINNMLYVDLCACATILFFRSLFIPNNSTDELNLVWWREQRPTSCNWIFKRATANQSFSVRKKLNVLRATCYTWVTFHAINFSR